MAEQDGVLSVEIFAAKDGAEVFMAVPRHCGLREADALRINGLSMVALQRKSIMPIDFAPLSEAARGKLVAWAGAGRRLAVAEFMARGIFNAYYLDVVVTS